MKFLKSLALFGFAGLFTLACTAESAAPNDGDEDEESMSEAELTATAAKVVGAWQDGGQAPKLPTFKGLVFRADRTFFMDVDSGLRPMCIPGGPCPDGRFRIEGKFTAGKKYITLSPNAGADRNLYHGRYNYTLTGTKLSLSRNADGFPEGWYDSLSKESSYCRKPVDCQNQGLIVPACVGSFSCKWISDSNPTGCSYSCGMPAQPE